MKAPGLLTGGFFVHIPFPVPMRGRERDGLP
jgi:hypothetical protein